MRLIERLMVSWGKTANLDHIVRFLTFEGFGERFNQQRIWLQSWLNFGQNSTKSLDFQKHFTGNLRGFNTDINLKCVMDTIGDGFKIVKIGWESASVSKQKFPDIGVVWIRWYFCFTTNFSNWCVWSVKVVVSPSGYCRLLWKWS